MKTDAADIFVLFNLNGYAARAHSCQSWAIVAIVDAPSPSIAALILSHRPFRRDRRRGVLGVRRRRETQRSWTQKIPKADVGVIAARLATDLTTPNRPTGPLDRRSLVSIARTSRLPRTNRLRPQFRNSGRPQFRTNSAPTPIPHQFRNSDPNSVLKPPQRLNPASAGASTRRDPFQNSRAADLIR